MWILRSHIFLSQLKTSPQECLEIHEDFIARMKAVDEEIEYANKCIDDVVMTIKTSARVSFSKPSLDSIMEDFCTVTESILKTKTPLLYMNNTAKLIDECLCYMQRIVPSVLVMSIEEWSRYKENMYSTVRKLELWTIECLKIHEHDFEKDVSKLEIKIRDFETYYREIYCSYMYFRFLERTNQPI